MAARPRHERGRRPALGVALALALYAAAAQSAPPPQPVIDLAQARWEQAWSSANARVAHCLQLARRRADPRALQAAVLSARQKEVAAFVLSARAQAVCEHDARGAAALALANYRAVLRHHGRELTASDAEREAALADPARALLEKEALEYTSIDARQRTELEGMAEFRAPFDFIAALETLRGAAGR